MAQDDFETDIDVDTTADDIGAADDGNAGFDAAPQKKSGGFLFKAVVVLVAVAIGGFIAARQFGIQLPFAIPGLTQQQAAAPAADAQAQVQTQTDPVADQSVTDQTPTDQTAASAAPAGLDNNAMPPMPEAASADASADPLAAFDAPVQPVADDAGLLPAPLDGAAAAPADAGANAAADPFAAISGQEQPAQDVTADVTQSSADADPLASQMQTGQAAEQAPAGDDPFAAAGNAPADTASAAPADTAAGIQELFPVPAQPAGNEMESSQEPMPAAEPATDMAAASAETVETAAPPAALPTAEPVIDQATAGKLQELEQRIADIEQTVTGLKRDLASKNDIADLKSALGNLESALASRPAAEPPSRILKPARAAVEDAAPRRTAPKAAAPKTPSSRAAWSPKAAGQSWVLKSAKPGTAWIAERGSNEMKTVTIGDTVSGIGRVTAIAQDAGGRWVVSGTQGKINQ